MRLVGNLDNEMAAFQFSTFLSQKGIRGSYEPFVDPATSKKHYHIWVQEEEDLEHAVELLKNFHEQPESPQYKIPTPKPVWKLKMQPRPPKFSFTLTNILIAVCIYLFVWTMVQNYTVVKEKGAIAVENGLVPLEEQLMFDYPLRYQKIDQFLTQHPLQSNEELNALPPEEKAEWVQISQTPMWEGIEPMILHPKAIAGPLFEKISQGEYWRLLTPIFLHGGLLHILFNMAWLYLLGKQMEERMGMGKLLAFVLMVGVIANLAQYFMSGFQFLGFSGVIVGMAGFIWSRQRIAPWEGYPLPLSTEIFIAVFVLAILLLSMLIFTLEFFSVIQTSLYIGNTAHIVGGICGILLGRLHAFGRRKR